MEEDRKEQQRKMAKVIAKAWSLKGFKERLIDDPRTVLEEEGVAVPDGIDVKVVEQTDSEMYIVLPSRAEAGKGCSWMCDDDAYDIPCAQIS